MSPVTPKKVEQIDVPAGSLIARFGVESDYRDCFAREVSGAVSLSEFIERFYCSAAFRPERLALGLIGRGASNADAMRLASGEAKSFAAWNVVERSSSEILLRDFSGATASWLSVQPTGEGSTRLFFGSWLAKPDRPLIKATIPIHVWYSKVLLAGA
ncbi:hypothetical protein [Erythrobacter sp. F6033]|uniref:hypothetical protein n=1 Tax=Erythrobacter sp. F6033 TaxID=2926401 RepID=UPI001FF37C33|nr:hypothetical protein [Erythrobacter sp. F6033]MCK0129491.1 hypothetical protein [Erythrobacter sp. F6033]